jgi:hypothetical protein
MFIGYFILGQSKEAHKRKYIGKLGKGGEFIPNKKYISRQNKAEEVPLNL